MPRVELINRKTGRYTLLKTALKNGLDSYYAPYGTFLDTTAKRFVSKKRAAEILNAGGDVILPQDEQHFPLLGRIINRAERVPLTLPPELKAVLTPQELKRVNSTKQSFSKKGLNTWQRIEAWTELMNPLDDKYHDAITGKSEEKVEEKSDGKFPPGDYTLVVKVVFFYARLDKSGKQFVIPAKGRTKDSDAETITEVITTKKPMSREDLADAAVQQYAIKTFGPSPLEYEVQEIVELRTDAQPLEKMPMGRIKAMYQACV